LKLKFKH